jgi:hypothetical protein
MQLSKEGNVRFLKLTVIENNNNNQRVYKNLINLLFNFTPNLPDLNEKLLCLNIQTKEFSKLMEISSKSEEDLAIYFELNDKETVDITFSINCFDLKLVYKGLNP